MSMYLYCIYNNDLLEKLLDVVCPLKINDHILTCPAFADDVAIVSKSNALLQHKVDIVVQQICDENQTKGSVSDKSTKIFRKLAEMILFEISYGPKLNKSKMAVIFKMAAKLKKISQNFSVIIKK